VAFKIIKIKQMQRRGVNKWQATEFSNVDTVVTWKGVKMLARTLGKSQDEGYEKKSLFLALG